MVTNLVQRFKRATKRPQSDNMPADMEWFGIRNLMRAAKVYNHFKYGGIHAYRRRLFREKYEPLMTGRGKLSYEPAVMRDGWAIDATRRNPHIDRILVEAEDLISKRGMKKKGVENRAFIRDILD